MGRERRPRASSNARWRMATGETIEISQMTDRHLCHTLRLLERIAGEIKGGTPSPDFQGEMAQYDAEREWDARQDTDISDLAEEINPAYIHLVREAERRGLSWEVAP
jgi:hypothetical protein